MLNTGGWAVWVRDGVWRGEESGGLYFEYETSKPRLFFFFGND